jgi:acetylornithine/succinyldiaminopimelate/putrescine aminotransferase
MKPIPISAAERIAKDYGYDQVIIVARKVGDEPDQHGEHVTTYGVNTDHCAVAARAGDFLKHKVMGWTNGG